MFVHSLTFITFFSELSITDFSHSSTEVFNFLIVLSVIDTFHSVILCGKHSSLVAVAL